MLYKPHLLPMYYVRKVSATTKKSLNEKTLIVILIISTLITLFFILNNLPAQVSLTESNFKELFVPRFTSDKQQRAIINRHTEHKNVHGQKSESQIYIQPIEPPPSLNELSNTERREKIKSMTLFAWNAYKKYAWGKNELKPLSKTGHTPGIFGQAHNLGATIVDGLDTLYLMGFQDEVDEGTEWIRKNFNISQVGLSKLLSYVSAHFH